jgi:SAM-dependent methyltransferase
MTSKNPDTNFDQRVIDSFGEEWSVFNYADEQSGDALDILFESYTSIVGLSQFALKTSTAADFGAGSGRWTSRLLPFFKSVYALEPSDKAFGVLQAKFSKVEKVVLLHQTVGDNSIPAESLDFAMCLGVLHHIPDTKSAMKSIYEKIKPGGIFNCYLYYKLGDKALHFRVIFHFASIIRWVISRLPVRTKKFLCRVIAVVIYLPFARTSRILASRGFDVSNIPLNHYAEQPFLMMKNDALDRFGTRLEQRFSKKEIELMLEDVGFDLQTLKYSTSEPFWTFTVRKK